VSYRKAQGRSIAFYDFSGKSLALFKKNDLPRRTAIFGLIVDECRLSLRERTPFGGAKGDTLGF
jgi:hypothetical protein